MSWIIVGGAKGYGVEGSRVKGEEDGMEKKGSRWWTKGKTGGAEECVGKGKLGRAGKG